MIGLVIALIVGIPVFYGCALATVAFAHRQTLAHSKTAWANFSVDEQHCFWCAFWVHAAKGISGESR